MKTLLSLCALLLFAALPTTEAQIFNKLKKRTEQKIKQKAERKVVEEVSEELANRAVEPLDDAIDAMLRDSYAQREGKDYDPEELDSIQRTAGKDYLDFLNSMNRAADVPPSYQFDLSMDVEVRDYDKEKSEFTMHYMKNKGVFAVEQEDDGKKQTVLIDAESDLMVIYTEENGELKAQALPSMLSTASNLSKSSMNNTQNAPQEPFKIRATGKTKKIAGYKAEEFKGENDTDHVTAYISDELPINWVDTFGDLMQRFAPKAYDDEALKDADGTLLESESESIETGKKTSWKTKKVHHRPFVIDNSKYDFGTEE